VSAPLTTLIGREESVAQAIALLGRDDVRLLTITGPGGVGKTRLADEVAAVAADQFADGVVLVPLQSLSDPGLVIGTVARSLGLFDGEGDLEQRLVDHLEGRRLLLVVDNFEQVVEAAPALAAVVAASPGLKVAVTSRTRLHVMGEQELPLAPLTREAAVSVFLERAREVRPGFQPDGPDLDAIAEICDRLDCLPLAIELAAARTKLLSPTAMLTRLERRLDLLTAGPRDAPARHRALRDTIAWSVELLDDPGRTLFGCFSVFVGGCTLEAVEHVCDGDLDTLGTLVDQSLVRAERERFGMLETIREYACDLLEARADAGETRRAHAAYYLRLAKEIPRGGGSDRRVTDHDNLRAALRFSLDAGEGVTALELCAALWRFWFERGYLSEGRRWLDEALAASSEASSARARVLSGSGVLAHYQGDYGRAEVLCQEALELSRTLEDARGVAEACTGLALVRRTRVDNSGAETLFREALAVYEELGEDDGVARTLDQLAMNFVVAGDFVRARPLFERSLALFRRLDDTHGIGLGLYGLVLTSRGDIHVAARAEVTELLDLLRATGDRRTFAKALWSLANVTADLGDTETAEAQCQESLTLFVEFGDRWFCGIVLETAAFLAAGVGDTERAVRLLGAADAIRVALEVPLPPPFQERHDRVRAESRARLGEDRFAAAWDEGRRLPIGATVEIVRRPEARDAVDPSDALTARELEVLRLVAQGLSDAEVAERLVISLRTVHAHLRSTYRKLGVHSRSGATRYAIEHGLGT
jgi:predicted ATPase/DNA-binding CsgD family transcriptional regulator